MSNNIKFVGCVDKVTLQGMPRKIAAREKSFQSMLEQYYKPKTKIDKMEEFMNILPWNSVPNNLEDSRAIKLRKNNMENTLMNSDIINMVITQRNGIENNSINDDRVIEPLSYDVNKLFSSDENNNLDESVTYSENNTDDLEDNTSIDSKDGIDGNVQDLPVHDLVDYNYMDDSSYSDNSVDESVTYSDNSVDEFDNDNTEEIDSKIDITVPSVDDVEESDAVTYSDSDEVDNISHNSLDDSLYFDENIRLPRGGNAIKISNYDNDIEDSNTMVAVPSFDDIVIKGSDLKIPKLDDILIAPSFKSDVEDIDSNYIDEERDVPIVVDDRDDIKADYTVSYDEDIQNDDLSINDISDRKQLFQSLKDTLKEKMQRLEDAKLKVNDAIELSKREEKAREESDLAVKDRVAELKKIVSAVDNRYEATIKEKNMYEAKIVENRKIKEENDQSIREMDSFIEEYSSTFRR